MSKAPHRKSAPKRARHPQAEKAVGLDTRTVALGVGVFVAGTAAVLATAFAGARRKRTTEPALPKSTHGSPEAKDPPAPTVATKPDPSPEHVPTDLTPDGDPGAGGRAPDAFRPDPTAPVPPEMRESLRPATGPGPTLSGGESVVSTFGDD